MSACMKSLLNKHLAIPETRESQFVQLVSGYVKDKRYIPLLDIIGAGKGFNDKTKKAFCEFLNVKPCYTKHGITKLVLDYCGIKNEEYETITAYLRIKAKTERIEKRLAEKYYDLEKIKQIISEQINLGRTVIKVFDRTRFMINPDDETVGFKLSKKDAADYATVRCELHNVSKAFMTYDNLRQRHPRLVREIETAMQA